MKKTYMQPLTKVIKINAETMICQSKVTLSKFSQSNNAALDKDDDFDSSDELW